MPLLPAPDLPAEAEVVRLGPAARSARLVGAAVVLALLLVGAVWGDDDAFPFGPFRMYSTRADPDAAVVSTRVVGLTAAGEEVRLSGGQVGLRRAEFEGQLPRVEAHPELLGLLADSWAAKHPGAVELVGVQVVQRRFELSDGQPTDAYSDTVVVEYDLEGGR
ncbi:conserved exported protein of unknown function [Modestobacter italicus]|uniref:Uncharacterized protein n=1 Tax=Modestobacter italicus (strain DSM 44449 / CECT 9708 / BC 501) TaxID=2732864 RepID=I4F336_MODI5|nr:hypothetical protein [Modestobacter marinus]CCH90049.1 conserved exported protein of unknown function [Modestobacter marinus]